MENVYIAARYLHIVAGIIAFFVAPVALLARKGGYTHIVWGKIFFWAIILVAFTALPMTLYHPNMFLFLISIFSVHLSLSGYRASITRKAKDFHKSKLIDKSIATGTLVVYLLLISWGIFIIYNTENAAFGYIAIVFGIVGLRFSITQLNSLKKSSANKMDWWFKHMQGMVGAYIATVSAFSAVNFYFLPPVIRWLWPTILGSIGLYIWESYYKKKFKKISATSAMHV